MGSQRLKGGKWLVPAQIEAICDVAQFLPSSTSPSCPSCSIISPWQLCSCHHPPPASRGAGTEHRWDSPEHGLGEPLPLLLDTGQFCQHSANIIAKKAQTNTIEQVKRTTSVAALFLALSSANSKLKTV